MDSEDMSELQKQMIQLQQQMCRQLEAAQTSMDTPAVTESTVVKPTLFHGRENENVDRWLQRFSLYLANRRIQPDSNQAAIQLALHLSGPAESFYYNLSTIVQASYEALKDALRERFSPAHRHLRLRQALSTRRQEPTESLENFLADLNEKFSCLDLRDEDKLSYLIQGLRPDLQADVLKKEPNTYAEAEDTARLIYSIQQSLSQRREEDISHIVQNATHTKASTTPQTQAAPPDEKNILAGLVQLLNKTATGHETSRMERLEKNVERLVSRLETQPQDMTTTPQSSLDHKVAAYQQVMTQTPEAEQLAYLQHQMHKLTSLISGHQSLAAYQSNAPRESSYNRDYKVDEIHRLKEEIRQLKAAHRESPFQRGYNADTYDRHRATQEANSDMSNAFEEIRRMQSRMDGFMRAYASRNSRQDQRVQTRDYRPICDICGKAGHVRQHCFHRFQQSPNHSQPQPTQNNREIAEDQPRVAAYEHVQEAPSRNQPSYDYTNLARRSQPIPSSSTTVSTEVPTINTIDAVTINSLTRREKLKSRSK
ncbi:hypothetical protein OS493_025829 [Desmophyllum pertusum]|uniref:Retrotransposon gag domain-containing protein n=1 Tax=Desmophyllum pertusum TaxID=174260 RepID=A0A9X0CPK7_9CNID|nr:hypothetical protein OS493_025829 [Desmophyllum pertusum]